MSRHWIAVKQQVLQQSQNISKVIELIAQTKPKLALQLAQTDWLKLRSYIATEALKETAAHFNIKFTMTFDKRNNEHGEKLSRPKGQIVGILIADNERLGVVIENEVLVMFHTRFDHDENAELSNHAKSWWNYFENRRQIRAIEAMAQIIGQDVETNTDIHGTTDIRFTVNEVIL